MLQPEVPLLMESGFKARGWLGILIGTRRYFLFDGVEALDDENFGTEAVSLSISLSLCLSLSLSLSISLSLSL